MQKIAELHGQLLWSVVSPDGKRIRLSALSDGGFSLWELQSDGKGLHLLLPNWKQPHFEFGGKWTPDGNYFVFQREEAGRWDLWAMPEKHSFFSNSAREPVRITNGPLSYGAPLLSRDGKQIFAVGSQALGELIRYDSTRKQFVPMLEGISATDAVFSPDGQWVVYLSYPDHTLWRSRADGSERVQLTYPPTVVFYPHISPDEKQVVYCSWIPGKASDVSIVSLAGGEPRNVGMEFQRLGRPTENLSFSGERSRASNSASQGFETWQSWNSSQGRFPRSPIR
jgi:Tol biopolymer transport system component